MKSKEYYPTINLYRFLAAIMVALFFHYSIVTGDSPFAGSVVGDFLNHNGGYVVELFFIISGFVAAGAYLTRIEDGSLTFDKFLISRIKRMYPTLIISVVAIMLMMWIGYAIWSEPLIKDSAVSPFAFILNMLGLNGGLIVEASLVSVNGPSWYISVLMVCYILFYATTLLRRKSVAASYIVYGIIIMIGLFVYLNPINLPFLSVSCARGYIYFFIGVLWAKVQKRLTSRKSRLIVCILSIVMILMYVFAYCYDLLYQESLEIGLCIIFPLVLIGINLEWLNKMCDNKVVYFLGNISFGVFMWNIPVLICVRLIGRIFGAEIDYSNILIFLIIAIINIVAGALSYEFIEKKLN